MTSIKNMNPPIVAITRADNYELQELRTSLVKALDLIGGLKPMVKPGNKVLSR